MRESQRVRSHNKYNVLGQSTALLEEIVRIYDEQLKHRKSEDMFRLMEWEDSPPETEERFHETSADTNQDSGCSSSLGWP